MATLSVIDDAREAFARQAWATARAAYAAAGDDARLTLDDLDRYAVAAHLAGDEAESRDALARGYRKAVDVGDATTGARFAFWIAHSMIFTGEQAQGSGWQARARNLLTERGADCVEWGYLMVPVGIEQLFAGDAETAATTFGDAIAIARRFADQDLMAMAGHGLGRSLIRLGRTAEGVAALDEAMIAGTSGEASPRIVGALYCGVLEACQEVFDVRRAREWTAVLTRWCEGQPELVPYRGPCLVHRVELMRLRGDWEDALEEARRACDWLSLPTSPEGPADAFYQLGELHRLRGDFEAAEEAYRQASRLGRAAEPGLALLWLSRGNADAADRALRRCLDETPAYESLKRSELLAAHVDVLVATGDVQGARDAADQLREIAEALDALPLRALADRAEGTVRIAANGAQEALTPLRRSWRAWTQIEAPYEAARVRVLIGLACQSLGDGETAAMEFDAARWVFERLGAAPDIARLVELSAPARSGPTSGLTARECEVLALIAAGETNKGIAAALVISEHTVARHVQNMLQKLGFSSRASLAAFSVEQGLARRAGQN